jgi:alpha-tubulin suppressor-like RCC1 family protein
VKRAAFAILVACGSPHATSTVPIPLASADAAPPPHVAVERQPALTLIAYYHTCLLAHGKLRCRNAVTPDVPFSKEPVLAGLENLDVKQASLGRDFGCAILRGGDVDCWGGNHFGQLGANVRDGAHAGPIAVVNLHGVKSVWAGPEHVCAILDHGRVACWGKNQFGENGSTTNYLEAARELVEPQIVPGVDDVVEVALGWDATYAATSNGTVITWGRRKLKEEPAKPEWTEQPRVLASLEGTTSLTSNEETFCGVQKDKLICWGQTYSFVKSSARDEIVTIPIEHPRLVRISMMHGCAVDTSGAVWCFGLNNDGQLGVPPDNDRYVSKPPVKVPGISRAALVVCASAMTCAVTVNDEIFCWGRFTYENEEVHPPTRIAL